MSPLGAAPVELDRFGFTSTPSTQYSYVNGSMLGGELDLYVPSAILGDVSIADGVFTLAPAKADPVAINLIYDGMDASWVRAYGLNHDLTGGGTNDRLRINLLSVTGNISFSVYLQDEENVNWEFLTVHGIEAGIHEFRFEDMNVYGLGVDIEAVKQVNILFNNLHEGEGFELGSMIFTGPGAATGAATDAAILARKIKALKNKLKKAKKRGQTSKLKRLKKSLKKLKSP